VVILVETPEYNVIKQIGEIEIRRYPLIFLATATGQGGDDLFGSLFRYISGDNSGNQKIAMTAPVITPEKIAMTAPVISDSGSMSFIVPSKYTREMVPKPLDSRISIVEVPARTMAVLRFSGWGDAKTVAEKKGKLVEVLTVNNIRSRGEIVLMRYNSPWTPWFARRNEVAVDIELEDAD
jgi:hypothetical protein